MITLNQYIEELIELQNKEYGKLPVVYATDDEGNAYQTVNNLPSEFKVYDTGSYYLEPDFEYDKNDKVVDFIPNCIIIN